jgi:hypothetical protein
MSEIGVTLLESCALRSLLGNRFLPKLFARFLPKLFAPREVIESEMATMTSIRKEPQQQ